MKKTRTEITGMIQVCLAFFLAGTSIVAGKFLSDAFPVMITAFLSLAIALCILLPLQIQRLNELKEISAGEALLMVAQALTGIVLTRFFTLYGLKYTGALTAGLINCTTPAVMTIASILLFKERIRRKSLFGLILVLGGMCLLSVIQDSPGSSANSLKGNMFIFAAVLCEVAMSLFRMKSTKKINSLTNTTVLFLISLVIIAPLAYREKPLLNISAVEPAQWLAIIFYGVFGSALAYILWGSGVVKVPGSKTGLSYSMISISTVLLSVLLLKEPFRFAHLVGLILCIGGIALCSDSREKLLPRSPSILLHLRKRFR